MQMQKKITLKEDGRFLVYYHFPDTATEEETQVFAGIKAIEDEKAEETSLPPSSLSPSSSFEGGVPHV